MFEVKRGLCYHCSDEAVKKAHDVVGYDEKAKAAQDRRGKFYKEMRDIADQHGLPGPPWHDYLKKIPDWVEAERRWKLNEEQWKVIYDAYQSARKKAAEEFTGPCVVVFVDYDYNEGILLCTRHLRECLKALKESGHE